MGRKKQFKAESKRLLDLMINSIYTNKEIFLRELISNASDAIDKAYYEELKDSKKDFNRDDYYIRVEIDKEERTLKIIDTGIGMTDEEMDSNLGIIAQSGTKAFKEKSDLEDDMKIIGQFGVGFYSAFMVAKEITVLSKSIKSDTAYIWKSEGQEGYSIEESQKDEHGTIITLHIKESDENNNFDQFLESYNVKSIIKKYSDFIRYPIKMEEVKSTLKEGSEDEYIEEIVDETLNSMVPIWRKNKNELQEEDYLNFYREKHYGFTDPIKYVHLSIEGLIRYNSILFIPKDVPFDYYTKEYEKGLELYANGVLIMDKCSKLLPDYFSFVKGMVDSEDLSLNISREILQEDKQLDLIGKNLKNNIKKELERILKNQREDYEAFFKSFGRGLKYGIYDNYGINKDDLQDLIMFKSTKDDKLITLNEYVESMKENQEYIYYGTGDSVEKLKNMPQSEVILEKEMDILLFEDEVDEFAIKVLQKYQDKEFKNIASGDLKLGDEDSEDKEESKETLDLFSYMKDKLGDKVAEVKVSKILKKHPVCLTNKGDISIEMEKILAQMPDNQMKAEKILEINKNHEIYKTLLSLYSEDKDKLNIYIDILYNQALLIEGLPIENPVEFSNKLCSIMK